MNIRKVSVFGIGKLGAPLVACVAKAGYDVVGVDLNRDFVRALNEGRAPVEEPGLSELIRAHRRSISATEDGVAAVLDSQATFIIVPTPSDPQGGFSTRYLLSACERIGDALRRKKGYHLVVVTCTVLPGATLGEVMPLLEARSGRKAGRDFGLCYSPEFIALGSVVRDFLNPDFVLIGEFDARSGRALEAFYKRVCDNDPKPARMSILNAELTKISVNTYVTTKITFANMLARLCERLPGADAETVTSAIGLDSRIGRKYLKGAIGYGGPCFPRDNKAFAHLARMVRASAAIAEATDALNLAQVDELARRIRSLLPKGGSVGLLGLSYKPDTPVVEESQAVLLARRLAREGVPVAAYDPAAMGSARQILGDDISYAASAEDCVAGADLVVLMTPWAEFKRIPTKAFKKAKGRRVMLDCWRLFKDSGCRKVVEYHVAGVSGAI